MKKRPERHNLLIALAVLMIAAALIGYGALFLRWVSDTPAPAPFSPRGPVPAPSRLASARERFRAFFLDPEARLGLSEALFAEGRLVDGFYVMKEAREFFGETAFRAAHERVVLHQAAPEVGEALSEAAKLERGDPLAAVTAYARTANTDPASPQGRAALDALSRLAQAKDSGPGAETGHLAQEALDELFKAHPKEPSVFAALAGAAWERGDTAGARALVAQALRSDPNQAGALMMDGRIALADGDGDKALKRFSAAWEKDPEDLYSAGELARLYDRERGDREAALPFYIALYRRNPDASAGEPVERIVTELLDARRRSVLESANPETLARYLSSDDGSLRAEACARAAALKDPRWVEPLAELLDDDIDAVRHNADYALYQIAYSKPAAIRIHKDEWLGSTRPLLRTRALNLFADLYTADTWPLAAASLQDQSPVVRYLTKTMVLDHYYKDLPAAQKALTQYLAAEKDPLVLALYSQGGRR